MAVILSFPERLAAERKAAAAYPAGARIVILPCIRRERIGQPAAYAAPLDESLPTQRHA